MNNLVIEQSDPIKNDLPAVWDMVINDVHDVCNSHAVTLPIVVDDMKARDQEGLRKYGVRLQPFNGRSAGIDGYQELLDASVYMRQDIYERKQKNLDVKPLECLYRELLRIVTSMRSILRKDNI